MVYFDNAATTKISPRVLAEMLPFLTEEYGNCSSHYYTLGKKAHAALDNSRQVVADFLNAKPCEIFFTSGGTESDNWAIFGTMLNKRYATRRHIITSQIEHHAVLNSCKYLEKNGYKVTYLPVDKYGLVDPDMFKASITDNTALASIMFANNEIGTIEPIEQLAAIARERQVLFHTDAVQAAGALKLDVEKLGVDMLSISGHKLYGPKGVGALYVRQGVRLDSYLHGGSQENGRRASTENLAGIVGLAAATTLVSEDFENKQASITAMRDRLIEGLLSSMDHVRLNGHPTKRLPGNVNISVEFVEGESLILEMDLKGFMVSSGSACTSGSLEPSHVLLALGLPHAIAHGSIRLSLGANNNMKEVEKFLTVFPQAVSRLRWLSPLC